MEDRFYKLPVSVMEVEGGGTHASWFLNVDVAAQKNSTGVQSCTDNVKRGAVQKRLVPRGAQWLKPE